MENCTQTEVSKVIHKGIQIENPCFTEDEIVRGVYPGVKRQSIDDMVVDLSKYDFLRKMYAYRPINPSPPVADRAAKIPGCPPDGKKVPAKRQTRSPGMKAHMLYPETRPGKGPAKIRHKLDR